MFKIRVALRIAAAVLAATLAIGGAVGLGAGADNHLETPGTEQAGGTWSFTGEGGGKDWSGTQGASWS
jgi:hypothetical protein